MILIPLSLIVAASSASFLLSAPSCFPRHRALILRHLLLQSFHFLLPFPPLFLVHLLSSVKPPFLHISGIHSHSVLAHSNLPHSVICAFRASERVTTRSINSP